MLLIQEYNYWFSIRYQNILLREPTLALCDKIDVDQMGIDSRKLKLKTNFSLRDDPSWSGIVMIPIRLLSSGGARPLLNMGFIASSPTTFPLSLPKFPATSSSLDIWLALSWGWDGVQTLESLVSWVFDDHVDDLLDDHWPGWSLQNNS